MVGHLADCCVCEQMWPASSIDAFFQRHPEHIGNPNKVHRCAHLKPADWCCPECLFGSGKIYAGEAVHCSGRDCFKLRCDQCQEECHDCADNDEVHFCAACAREELFTYGNGLKMCDECAYNRGYSDRSEEEEEGCFEKHRCGYACAYDPECDAGTIAP